MPDDPVKRRRRILMIFSCEPSEWPVVRQVPPNGLFVFGFFTVKHGGDDRFRFEFGDHLLQHVLLLFLLDFLSELLLHLGEGLYCYLIIPGNQLTA